jgi:putative acetyltransferase
MNGLVPARIRPCGPDEAPRLFEVFHSAIHRTARRDYTDAQVNAWAPADLDPAIWRGKIAAIAPFVVLVDERIVAYADLQPDGYIDHFFVHGEHARQGIGTLLMRHLLALAGQRGLAALTSDVSRTAQPFYRRFGFVVVAQREPVIRGVVVPNASMRLELAATEG